MGEFGVWQPKTVVLRTMPTLAAYYAAKMGHPVFVVPGFWNPVQWL
jgi:hypothetical protein